MEHRPLGKSGINVSEIALGTEYLIDEPQALVNQVIHHAIDHGINYFDIFYSQTRIRDALGEAFAGKRQGVHLTAHLGIHEVDGQNAKTRDLELSERVFNDYLRRLRTDYVDVLFVHNIDQQEDLEWALGNLLPQAQCLRDQGKAVTIGFSGHTVDTSLQAVGTGAFDVLMYPVNIAGHAVPGMANLLHRCAELNVGIVAMKPFGGGRLLRPETSVTLHNYLRGSGLDGDVHLGERKVAISTKQCLNYVLNRIGVTCALPGCKSVAEVDDCLSIYTVPDAVKDYSEILPALGEYVTGECTYCNHCLPCPSGIDIGHTQRLLDLAQGTVTADLRAVYANLPAPASDCIMCNDCTPRCPFGVSTMDRIQETAALFEG